MITITQPIRPEALTIHSTVERQQYDIFSQQLTHLAIATIYHYLKLPMLIKAKINTFTATQLKKELSIQPEFDKFIDFMLITLTENKVISLLEDGQLSISNIIIDSPNFSSLIHQFPEFDQIIKVFIHCTTYYSEVLSGKIPAVNVLYPQGNLNYLYENLSKNVVPFHGIPPCKIQLINHIKNLTLSQDKIKILEIGAGMGELSWELIAHLPSSKVQYHYTDIGRSFLNHGIQQAKILGYDFMQFKRLDISQDPTLQNFSSKSFDVVLALNVIHATSNVNSSLQHINYLLRETGQLCIIESLNIPVWLECIFGLATGWWFFNDNFRTHTPLIPLAVWRTIFADQPYKQVEYYPQHLSDTSLIIAHN